MVMFIAVRVTVAIHGVCEGGVIGALMTLVASESQQRAVHPCRKTALTPSNCEFSLTR